MRSVGSKFVVQDLVVKLFQFAATSFPMEMFLVKSLGPLTQADDDGLVLAEALQRFYDAQCIYFGQDPRMFAVFDKTADVGVRQNDRATHGKEFRQL